MSQTETAHTNFTNRFWFRYASLAISAGLLASFAASFILVGKYFFPGWNGIYFAPVAFITALDGMLSYRRLRHTGFPDKEWILYRFSEWIVILLLLKIGYYLTHTPQAFLMDLNYLTNRLWGNLFSGEFIFSIVVMMVVWMFSGRFADLLGTLEVDEALLRVEQESGIYEMRSQAREGLVSLLLTMGVIMVLITSLLGTEAQVDWRENSALRSGVTNLLAYFFLTLFLFSLSQLNLLSTTWIREGLTIRSELVRNWLVTSAVVILFLAVLAGILPTGYSIGLLNVLHYLVTVIMAMISYLIFFISAPFFMVVAFLASIFNFSSAEMLEQPEPVLDLPPPPVDTAPLPWLELLKSILFWLILVGMLAFAVYYYLHENQALWSGLKRLALFRRLAYILRWISEKLSRANQTIQEQVQHGWQAIRSRFQSREFSQIPSRLNLRRLSAREKVFFYYLAMLRRSSERGPARQPWQTPYEYLHELVVSYQTRHHASHQAGLEQLELGIHQDPDSSLEAAGTQEWLADTQALTEYFMQARYSTQPVSAQDASMVKRIWDRLRKVFRKQRG
ncbi:MAG TPA: DUF4129 domain-containing protein [Anaerolineales bacterium]|nr:DUF4129 domain-containing protein [Anaerolineales bacterium]